jgi:glycosyltransferase involved in cell wall biosynthesis
MVVRTAFLTNFVPPYRVKLLTALRERLGVFRIFVSTTMEADRPWRPDCGTLDVVVQKSKTFQRVRHHPNGCDQYLYIHFPYDTLNQLRHFAPQVVISSEFGLRTFQAAIYRLFRPSSRLVIWATLSEQTERGWGIVRQLLRKTILLIADGVICNGASGARYIANFGFRSDRIFVINQPVDVSMFAVLPAERSDIRARRLLFSGRLIPIKAVLQLQAACSRWAMAHPEQTIELVWLGDGELRPQLEATSVPPNFKQVFHGNKPYEDLPQVYESAGALVLPSLLDEWGLVVNEAMTSGLVVLGSIYSQAVTEMVRDNDTGWLLDPLRPETIDQCLDRLFATPVETLNQMRAAARRRALEITPERAAAQLAAAIEAVLPIRARKLQVPDAERGGSTDVSPSSQPVA